MWSPTTVTIGKRGAGRRSIFAATIVALMGCDAGTFVEPAAVAGDPARVVMTVDTHTFTALEQTLQVEAEARDGSGTTVSGVRLEWTSTDPSILSVDSMGMVTARAAGNAMVIAAAACCAAADTATLHVEQVPATVSVTPAAARLGVGQTAKLSAQAKDANGHVTPASVQFSSSDPDVVSVTADGLAEGRRAGAATITAAAGPVSAPAQVEVEERATVTPPPAGGLWFSDDFESGNTAHTANGFRWNNADWDVSGEHAYSGTHALRFHYPGKPRGLDHNSELRFTIAETAADAPSELWVEYYLRVPENFVHRNEWARFGQDQVTLANGGVPATGSIEAGSDILTIDQAGTFPDFIGGDGRQAVTRWQVYISGAGEEGADHNSIRVTERISDTQVRIQDAALTTASGTEVTFRVSTDVHNGLNNKFFVLWGERYEGGGTEANFLMEFQHQSPTNWLDVTWAHPRYALGAGEGEEALHKYTDIQAPLFRTEDRGEWVRMRVYVRIHDTDGQYRVWRDDTLVAELEPGHRTSEGEGTDYLRHGYLMGWSNTGYTEDTTFYIDDFRLHTSDPGW